MREELFEMLKFNGYRRGSFILSSGKDSYHYLNCKPVTLSGKGLFYASCLLSDFVEEDSVAVGGLTLGADPLVSGVAVVAAIDDVKLDALIVRKEVKDHGTGSLVEGPQLAHGSQVTVLEDVTTTGESAMSAAESLRDVGFIVNRVVSLVDRQDGAEEALKKNGLELKSIFKLDEFYA